MSTTKTIGLQEATYQIQSAGPIHENVSSPQGCKPFSDGKSKTFTSSWLPALTISSWFWIRNLTSSMGPAAVFDTATKTHSIRKPIANRNSPFSAGFERRRVVVVGHLVSWWIREDLAFGKHFEGVNDQSSSAFSKVVVVGHLVSWWIIEDLAFGKHFEGVNDQSSSLQIQKATWRIFSHVKRFFTHLKKLRDVVFFVSHGFYKFVSICPARLKLSIKTEVKVDELERKSEPRAYERCTFACGIALWCPVLELVENPFFEMLAMALRPRGVLCNMAESIGVTGFILCSTDGPPVDFKIPINPIEKVEGALEHSRELKFYNSQIAAFSLPLFIKREVNFL
ncbi:hypothetical protein Tco_1493408 [Tanacetum coccineum]